MKYLLIAIILGIGAATLFYLDCVMKPMVDERDYIIEEYIEEPETVSLGEFEITHYCLENYPHICNDGDSSRTASGQAPIPDYTVAADKSIPFGTKLIIDGMEYEVMDRGGAITEGRLDIAVLTHQEAINRGRITRIVEVKQ